MKSWHLLLGAGLLAGIVALLLLQGPQSGALPESEAAASAPPAAATPEAGTAAEGADHRDLVRRDETAAAAGGAGVGSWVTEGDAGTVTARLVRGDGAAAEGAVVRMPLGPSLPGFLEVDHSGPDDQGSVERKPVAADGTGRVRLTVPAGEDLTLEFGGAFWRAQQRSIAPLRPDETVDLGEIALAPAARVSGIVEDPQGRPLAGARTQMRAADAGMFWEGHELLQSSTSDAAGRVQFDGVPVGRFRIEGEAAGLGRGVIEALAVPSAPGEVQFRLRLPEGATVQGRTVDADRRPVAGARIFILRSNQEIWWGDYVPPLPEREPDAVSGADGSFLLRGLPEDGTGVSVLAGAEEHAVALVKEVLPNASLTVVLPPALAVRGRVLADGDRPVADANVTLSQTQEWGWEETKAQVQTDADGRFELVKVEPGEYTLAASAQGSSSPPLKLKVDRALDDLILHVAPRPALRILVTDPLGQPLEGAMVDLRTALANAQSASEMVELGYSSEVIVHDASAQWSESRQTGADGVALFHGAPGGELTLEARHPEWARHKESFQHSGAAAEHPVKLEKPAALLVRALDGAGAPVRGAALRLRMPDSGEEFDERRTDAAGRVLWSDLAPGAYELLHGAAAGANAGGNAWGGFVRLVTDLDGASAPPPADGVPVLLVAGECLVKELILSDLAVPTVRVTRGGAPAANVAVRLERIVEEEATTMNFYGGLHGSGMGNRTTDARGRIVLDPVEAGRYAVYARPTRNAPETRVETDFTPGPCEVEVRLNGARVRGVVRSSQGPVVGARMSLAPWAPEGEGEQSHTRGYSFAFSVGGALVLDSSSEGECRASSDADGEYVFEDVPEGRWVVACRATGFSPWTSLPFSVTGDQDVELPDQSLLPGGVIHGRNANWKPGEEASAFGFDWERAVRIETEAGEMIGMTQADENGEYKIEDLSEGSYFVIYGSWKSEPISIRPGQQQRVDVPKVEPRKAEPGEPR